MRIDLTPVARECGPCTLCCKVLTITDPQLQKPAHVWCAHAKKGAGCALFGQESRPAVCGEFLCLWRERTAMTDEFRPDKVHAVMTPTTDGKNLCIHEDTGYPGVGRRKLAPIIDRWVADGTHYVIVVCGDKRTYIGNPALHPEVFGARH